MASDHVHGEMEIQDQKSTFDGFMAVTVWSSILIVACVFSLTLIFAVGMDWMISIILGTAVCVLGGLALGLKTNWHITVAAVTVIAFISGAITSLGVMLFG